MEKDEGNTDGEKRGGKRINRLEETRVVRYVVTSMYRQHPINRGSPLFRITTESYFSVL